MKKPYTKPKIKKVKLSPQDAVLQVCKCTVVGTTCSNSPGSTGGKKFAGT